MNIAVLKETSAGEKRVALTPDAVRKLSAEGLEIKIEKDAGLNAGFADKEYMAAGAKMAPNAKSALQNAEFLFKINAPSAEESKIFPENLTVIADFRGFSPDRALIKKQRFSFFALDRIPRISRAQSMDILSSQDNLAGYKAVLEAVNTLNRAVPMMTTAAGSVMPVRVLIIGVGVAGLQAMATAKRLGASVYASDIREEAGKQAESLGARFIEKSAVNSFLYEADIIITAAGSLPAAPLLLGRKEIKRLKANSVLVDIAGNVGGIGQKEIYTAENGTVVISDRHLASSLPDTASRLFANNICNFFNLPGFRERKPDFADDIINQTCLCWQGKIRSRT